MITDTKPIDPRLMIQKSEVETFEAEFENESEFDNAVLALTIECIGLFSREASAIEISEWADKIPARFPEMDVGRLLYAVKEKVMMERVAE